MSEIRNNRGLRLIRTYEIESDSFRWYALSDKWKEGEWPRGISDRMELSYEELMEIYKTKTSQLAMA